MPELPEVQTIVNDLNARICGCEIFNIKTLTRSIWRHNMPRKKGITGAKVVKAGRRGKYILIYLSSDLVIIIHLGMTGRLLFMKPASVPEKHTHLVLRFSLIDLHYNDIRRFGFVDSVAGDRLDQVAYLSKLGPDPFVLGKDEFITMIRSKARMIKPLLLDQNVISGLGNIYSDEILYHARIHPRAVSSKITKRKLANLYEGTLEIIANAIKARGSSISNYVDGSGVPGFYQNSHLVYGRDGKPCGRCGAKIRREIIGSRSAHYCPRCQRL